MSTKDYPSIEYVRQCFRENNGRLWWLTRPRTHFKTPRACATWNARFSLKEAGYCNARKDGPRWLVSLDNAMMYRYSIVWMMHRGQWPEELDHENRNSLDDRIENLRPANQSQNMANGKRRSNNTSGFKGVVRRGKRKWVARIHVNGECKHLGSFDTPEEAHISYCVAAKNIFGEFACDG